MIPTLSPSQNRELVSAIRAASPSDIEAVRQQIAQYKKGAGRRCACTCLICIVLTVIVIVILVTLAILFPCHSSCNAGHGGGGDQG